MSGVASASVVISASAAGEVVATPQVPATTTVRGTIVGVQAVLGHTPEQAVTYLFGGARKFHKQVA